MIKSLSVHTMDHQLMITNFQLLYIDEHATKLAGINKNGNFQVVVRLH